MARSCSRIKVGARRAILFVGIALALPLAACKLLSKDDDAPDAAPSGTEPVVTATPTGAVPNAQPSASAAPTASVAPLRSSLPVVVRLRDGGSMTIDASVGPNGVITLPPGFQLPTMPGFAGFDAAAFKLPAFDAAAIPPLPSGFPQFPRFGGVDGGK